LHAVGVCAGRLERDLGIWLVGALTGSRRGGGLLKNRDRDYREHQGGPEDYYDEAVRGRERKG